MKKLSLIIATVFILGIANLAKADKEENNHQVNIDIPTLALIDIESATNSLTISLSPSAPQEAGLGLNFTDNVNNNLWLNYTSIVNNNGSKNSISAKIEGELPEGVTIELFVEDCVNGKGGVGKRKGGNKAVQLSSTGKEIIHNIRTGYTGNGAGNGHNLSYSLNIDNNSDYEKIVSESKDVNVVYTIYNHKLE